LLLFGSFLYLSGPLGGTKARFGALSIRLESQAALQQSSTRLNEGGSGATVMSDAFFPTQMLIHDKKFVASAALSVTTALVTVALSMYFLQRSKIDISPIASVEFVSPPPSANIKPISQIVASHPSENSGDVWEGYLVNFQQLCQSGAAQWAKDAMVLVKKGNTLIAGTAKVDSRTCAIANGIKGDEALYAASDQKFENLPSEKRFVSVNYDISSLQAH
jgi:hypothetical protein